MAHQGESGGSNPSGHFTPSFPAPATIGAQASQALFRDNQRDASIGARAPQLGHPSAADTVVPPPAVEPQILHFQPKSQPRRTTMPQAGAPNAMPLQHFSGTAAVQPLHSGMELAARVEAINTSPYQPFQHHIYYAHGWSQSQPWPQQQQQQAPPAPRYAALQTHVEGEAPSNSGNPLPPPPQGAHILQRPMVATAPPNRNSAAPPNGSWTRPMLPASGWPRSCVPHAQQPGGGGQTSWAPPPPVQQPGGQTIWAPPPPPPVQQQQPGGQTSWAPPVQQPGGQASSWAWAPPSQSQQRPGTPAASPASGSAQAQPPPVTGRKTVEEFLLEAGVLDQQTLDKIYLDELAEEMLGDGQAELGRPVERDDGFISLADVLVALGAVSSSGPSTHQARLPAQEALSAGDQAAAGSSSGPSRHQARVPAQEALGAGDQAAAAAEARERRSRRMAKRREAAARHRRP